MTNLRPPDGRVFVEIERKLHKQTDCVIKKIGNGVEFEVEQRVCVVGKLEKVELQDVELYSVDAEKIVAIYE